MKCADCRFWVRQDEGPLDQEEGGFGECHRKAPAPTFDGPLIVARMLTEYGRLAIEQAGDVDSWVTRCVAWPVTYDRAFCGEFAAKAEKRAGYV